ncbi:putative cytoplasmic protein [Escherichia coli]|nr:putative cytoplasmic protein [Escherichia coli]
MQSLDPLFARLSRSKFRSRFRLGMKERQYCLEKGAPVIEQHAADFVAKRLAPALPANDGKQTPMRGASGVYRSARHRDLLSRLSG